MSDNQQEIEGVLAEIAAGTEQDVYLSDHGIDAAARLILEARRERDAAQSQLAFARESFVDLTAERDTALARVKELEAERQALYPKEALDILRTELYKLEGKLEFYHEANAKLAKLTYEQKDRIAELEAEAKLAEAREQDAYHSAEAGLVATVKDLREKVAQLEAAGDKLDKRVKKIEHAWRETERDIRPFPRTDDYRVSYYAIGMLRAAIRGGK